VEAAGVVEVGAMTIDETGGETTEEMIGITGEEIESITGVMIEVVEFVEIIGMEKEGTMEGLVGTGMTLWREELESLSGTRKQTNLEGVDLLRNLGRFWTKNNTYSRLIIVYRPQSI